MRNAGVAAHEHPGVGDAGQQVRQGQAGEGLPGTAGHGSGQPLLARAAGDDDATAGVPQRADDLGEPVGRPASGSGLRPRVHEGVTAQPVERLRDGQ